MISKNIIRLLTATSVCSTGVIGSLFGETATDTLPKYKNVILILTDDMGYHLSALGTPGIRTPNIDKLLHEGTLFSNALSTCSSSAPSRSAILTGMYPHSNGHWRNTHTLLMNSPEEDFRENTPMRDIVGVKDSVVTLPEILAANNFHTAIMRKYHLSYPWKFRFTQRCNTGNTPEAYKKDIQSIVQQANGKPFFIMANISAPHRPWPGHVKQFKGQKPTTDQIEVPPYLPDLDSVRVDLLNYYISVMYADQLVGGILSGLKESHAEDETLIIFTSDQGPAFHRAKASPYYEGTHVPLIIKGDGIQKDFISSVLTSQTDLLPTILDALGLTVPDQAQGQSLLPIASGQADRIPERKYIFTTHNSHGPIWSDFYPSRAIFDGRFYLIRNLMPEKNYGLPDDLEKSGAPWYNLSYDAIIDNSDQCPKHYQKLIELQRNRPPYELYDIQNDPGQMTNLYGLPEYENIRVELEEQLEIWRKKTGDTPELLQEMIDSYSRSIPFVIETQRRKQLNK